MPDIEYWHLHSSPLPRSASEQAAQDLVSASEYVYMLPLDCTLPLNIFAILDNGCIHA